MYRVLVTLLLCVVLGAPSRSPAAEHWLFAHSGEKPGPNSRTTPATEVMVGGTGAPGHALNILKHTNYYEIQFGPTAEECYDWHGTVMGDFSPRRCSAGSGNPLAPCTTDPECTNGGTCDIQTIGGFFYTTTPDRYCAGEINLKRECWGDNDCPGSGCNAQSQIGSLHWKVSLACVGPNGDYLLKNMTQTTGLGVEGADNPDEWAGGMKPIKTSLPAVVTGSCRIGTEFILRICRQPADVEDDWPSWASILAIRLSM